MFFSICEHVDEQYKTLGGKRTEWRYNDPRGYCFILFSPNQVAPG